jgi:hypothetical protein
MLVLSILVRAGMSVVTAHDSGSSGSTSFPFRSSPRRFNRSMADCECASTSLFLK